MRNEAKLADHLRTIPAAARHVRQNYDVSEPHHDYSFSPGGGMLRLNTHKSSYSGTTWWSGDFADYRGLVSIQMEDTYLRLDAIADGRCHVRTWGEGLPTARWQNCAAHF